MSIEMWCSDCDEFRTFEIETFTDPADVLCSEGHIITSIKTEDPGVYELKKVE